MDNKDAINEKVEEKVMEELNPSELEEVTGGIRRSSGGYGCTHHWQFVEMVPGLLWGENYRYKCVHCGDTLTSPFSIY